jgi:hypothetical protein
VSTNPLWVIGAIVVIMVLVLIGAGLLIRFLYTSTTPDERKGISIPTLLGVAALGTVAVVCAAGITYGLSVGQTGSIETAQKGQAASQVEQTTPGQSRAEADVGTQGVVSSSQGLGILGTIGSAAVGGIAGVLVQQRQSND